MATQPLVLHAHATGPNPMKIAIALELLKVPYTLKLWDISDDPEKGVRGGKFLAINENGRVPALQDSNTGVTSWESGAVMNYVRRVYDKSGVLGPRNSQGQATEQDIVDLQKWEYFVLSTVGPMTGQVNWFRYHHSLRNEDALNRYIEQTHRCYSVIEGQLAKSGGQFILPSGLSSVDVHFEPLVREYKYSGLILKDYPRIENWLKTMGDMDEVKVAYQKVEEAAKV